MSPRHLLIPLFVVAALIGSARSAQAGNYVVYLHGRSMNGWPSPATLGATPDWSHVTLTYNGSASLADSGIRNTIADTLATYCGGGNHCVVVCYSAGCARMLDSYKLLKDQGRYPANILWSEAAASAAGGSELAAYSTKWWVKLLAKIFNMDGAAAIDYDIQPNIMRYGAYASIQNQATAPVYHLAGNQDICITIKILFFIRVKLCGNDRFPGDQGDGVVPVHSAGGYADTGAHYDTNDGSAKYVFRAYEQTPLFAADHRGIFGPLVALGSLRLAVGKNASCPNLPTVPASVPDASIIYDDGDGAFTEESSPLGLLVLVGGEHPQISPGLNRKVPGELAAGVAGGQRNDEQAGQRAGNRHADEHRTAHPRGVHSLIPRLISQPRAADHADNGRHHSHQAEQAIGERQFLRAERFWNAAGAGRREQRGLGPHERQHGEQYRQRGDRRQVALQDGKVAKDHDDDFADFAGHDDVLLAEAIRQIPRRGGQYQIGQHKEDGSRHQDIAGREPRGIPSRGFHMVLANPNHQPAEDVVIHRRQKLRDQQPQETG